MRTLDPKQRKALELFREFEVVTAKQIGDLFGFQPRTNAALCKKWAEGGFLEIVDYSNKARKYSLAFASGRYDDKAGAQRRSSYPI